MSGWPSAVRPGVYVCVPAARCPPGSGAAYVVALPTAMSAAAARLHSARVEFMSLSLVAAGLRIQLLVREALALVLEETRLRLLAAVEHRLHVPRPGEHLRVLDGHAVADVIGTLGREALDHVQLLGMEVAGAIEPGLVVEVHRVHHQRVAVPSTTRVPQPPVDWTFGMWGAVGKDRADRAHV